MSDTPTVRPVALQILPENIPGEIKALRVWTCWRYEWNEKRQKWAKIPYIPFTTAHAKSGATFSTVCTSPFKSLIPTPAATLITALCFLHRR